MLNRMQMKKCVGLGLLAGALICPALASAQSCEQTLVREDNSNTLVASAQIRQLERAERTSDAFRLTQVYWGNIWEQQCQTIGEPF
jgi:hypothetical protein